MHFTEYDTRLAAYAALTNDEGCLLLTWYNGEGMNAPCWTMPGGGVEYEESLVEAVEREVFEETGYTVSVGVPIVANSFTGKGHHSSGRPFKAVRIVFSAVITGGNLGTTEVSGSTDFAQWIPLEDVPALPSKADIIDVAYAAMTTA